MRFIYFKVFIEYLKVKFNDYNDDYDDDYLFLDNDVGGLDTE